jgi:hypothetical protein
MFVFLVEFPLLSLVMCQTIVDCLSPIVITCVLNESKDHWLVSDPLKNAITMSSKLKENLGIV